MKINLKKVISSSTQGSHIVLVTLDQKCTWSPQIANLISYIPDYFNIWNTVCSSTFRIYNSAIVCY